MSNEAAAKSSVKDVVEEARRIANQKSQSVKGATKEDDKFSNFTKTNLFARILLDGSLSPEGKRDEMTKALSFSKEASKEENRAKLDELALFKEFLQEQRKILNREGIKLQDTEAFAELQSVIDDMTKASISFQAKAKPLLEVLSAVFEIRKQDKITEVYKEIQNDKAWQDEQAKILAQLEKELTIKKDQLDSLEREKARLFEQKSLFGLGPPKKSARERIAEIETVERANFTNEINEIINKVTQQKKVLETGRASENPELMKQKAILKQFLDLTREENRNRQKALVQAAVEYVDTSDSKLKSVIGTLERLGKHAEVVSDSNGMLKNVHLIMDESLKSVAANNKLMKGELAKPAADESSIGRMTREEKLNDLNEYMTRTDEAAVDIANSIGGLTKHAVQIQSYKDTLRNESSSSKRLHLEGVSQMGEQLMSVISAISAAATTESRSVAANNFAKMAEQNQTIISQEVVRNATSVDIEARQIAKLVGELSDYGDVLSASSEIASQGYGRMRETVDAIRKVSGSVQDAITQFVSDRAEADLSGSSASKEKNEDGGAAKVENPLEKLNTL